MKGEDASESAAVKGAAARATSEESPERRLLRAGAAGLSTAEVLSVLLRGDRERSAHEEAIDLLVACGDLSGLAGEAPPEVNRLPEGDRAAVLAALELARRLAGAATWRMEITRPGRLAGYLYLRFARLDQEVVGAVWLDARRRVIEAREVFRGTFHGATVESRPILRVALELRAATVIVFHTHPGGDPTPSEQDLVWTSRLNEACQAVGVELLDHLVIAGPKAWVSIREKGWPTPGGPATAERLAAGARWERARCLGNAPDWSVRCRRCAGFAELSGPLGPSWGACTMAGSPFDGRLVYEGDGCGAFSPLVAPAPAAPEAGDGRRSGGEAGPGPERAR